MEQAFYPALCLSYEGTRILNVRGSDTTDSILPSGQYYPPFWHFIRLSFMFIIILKVIEKIIHKFHYNSWVDNVQNDNGALFVFLYANGSLFSFIGW